MSEEAQQQLEDLKLRSEMLHMQQKWTGRIKALNIEVTASLSSARGFTQLKAFLDFDWCVGM